MEDYALRQFDMEEAQRGHPYALRFPRDHLADLIQSATDVLYDTDGKRLMVEAVLTRGRATLVLTNTMHPHLVRFLLANQVGKLTITFRIRRGNKQEGEDGDPIYVEQPATQRSRAPATSRPLQNTRTRSQTPGPAPRRVRFQDQEDGRAL